MNFIYTENEKRHIFESETGHLSTFLKDRVTKEQAEALFLAQLSNEGITTTANVDEIPVTGQPQNVVVNAPEIVTGVTDGNPDTTGDVTQNLTTDNGNA